MILTPFFWLNDANPLVSSTQFSGTRTTILANLLNKWEDEVSEADEDRIHIWELERQSDGEIIQAVVFDDAIVGSLDIPLTVEDLAICSRL